MQCTDQHTTLYFKAHDFYFFVQKFLKLAWYKNKSLLAHNNLQVHDSLKLILKVFIWLVFKKQDKHK